MPTPTCPDAMEAILMMRPHCCLAISRAASASAWAFPMPRRPPVTSATFPVRSNIRFHDTSNGRLQPIPLLPQGRMNLRRFQTELAGRKPIENIRGHEVLFPPAAPPVLVPDGVLILAR